MNWGKFFDMYNARFGRLTENDGISEWRSFVDGVTSDSLMTTTLDQLGERYIGADRKPKLPEVKAAFWENARIAKLRRGDAGSGLGYCSCCRGSRRVTLFAARPGAEELWPERPEDFPLDAFYSICVYPCPACMADRWRGIAPDKRQRAIAACAPDNTRELEERLNARRGAMR